MGERQAVGTAGSCCALLVSVVLLAAYLTLTVSRQAQAQTAPAAACQPAVARLVALQGAVELQRADSVAWVRVTRLDTALCAGDRLRTGVLSRAGLHVVPETIVRVDQNTVITLNHSAEEIAVEFFVAELAARAADAQSCGAGYFITRFPKKFKVRTPHMNAAVEGTEFMVETSCDATRLTVLEGAVSSESAITGDRKLVEAGQSLASGAAGAGVITTVVRPADAVQWVLRFPPISDGSNASRAETLLRAGSIDAALIEIDTMLRDDPDDSDALALRSVVKVAKNDNPAALESAVRATAANAGNHRAWIARSYAEQSSFELAAALVSARKAATLQAQSALAHARLAELHLSLGDPRQAEVAARASVNADSNEAAAHAILGFVHLTNVDIDKAHDAFTAAIERDSFNALPRLGLGLAKIRDGKLTEGREELEIAVALDPSNSLLRSYLGKAYYEENSEDRNALAAEQFQLAHTLDPRDPTPHFYDAILKYSQSQPVDALASLVASSGLNDDRAVYRSRQLLDLDLAARNASQATVYNELGLHQLGLVAAVRSLALDPGNGSAHRFLADIYAATPGYEISRASELLVSQLRQPLGAQPLQTQLANDVLFKNAFFGPATVGLLEFNPLFVRDDTQFQLFGFIGNQDSYGNQAILSGLNGPVAFSIGQVATETDGYRSNNDNSVRQYNGFIQAQLGSRTSAQFELTSSDRDFGDLRSAFDPTFFSATQRNDEDIESQRLGIKHTINSSSDLLISAIARDFDLKVEDPDFFFPVILAEEETWKIEAQYLKVGEAVDLILGGSYFDGDLSTTFISPFFEVPFDSEPDHINAYGYLQFGARSGLPLVQIGLSYDDLSSDSGDQSELNPKVGILWNPTESIGLRAAAFRVLKRSVGSDQGLEPTQLAGFNQFFDDSNGTISEGAGLAADLSLSESLSTGFQLSRRNLEAPFLFDDGSIVMQNQREDVASGYLYWLPNDRTSVTLEPRYHDFERGAGFDRMRLTEVPISVRFFSPSGWRIGLTGTAVEQDGDFDGPFEVESGSDSFWLLDAIIAYRLPRRMGTISLEGANILDEGFQFQEIDQATVSPRYVPEMQIRLRVTMSF